MTVTFDLSCGVSGDMLLGSLLEMYSREHDVGDITDRIQRAASIMSPTEVTLGRTSRNGLEANSLSVSWEPLEESTINAVRMMELIEMAIGVAGPGERGAATARSMMNRILEAEMMAHLKTDIAEVHLHETGSPDTIVDIMGISLLYERLELFDEWVHATPLSLGKGTVNTEHGILQVPVPAVRAMIGNMNTKSGPVEGELATPTGVAAISSIVEIWQDDHRTRGVPVGRGAGSREYGRGFSNVLTVYQED